MGSLIAKLRRGPDGKRGRIESTVSAQRSLVGTDSRVKLLGLDWPGFGQRWAHLGLAWTESESSRSSVAREGSWVCTVREGSDQGDCCLSQWTKRMFWYSLSLECTQTNRAWACADGTRII